MKKILLASICVLLSIPTSNASTINICDRGRIGELITQEVGASFSITKIFSPPCSKVNKNKMSKMKILDFSNKEIKKIPKNAFVGFDSLKKLLLDNNQITILEENAFTGLDSLEELRLDNNQITTFQKKTSS